MHLASCPGVTVQVENANRQAFAESKITQITPCLTKCSIQVLPGEDFSISVHVADGVQLSSTRHWRVYARVDGTLISDQIHEVNPRSFRFEGLEIFRDGLKLLHRMYFKKVDLGDEPSTALSDQQVITLGQIEVVAQFGNSSASEQKSISSSDGAAIAMVDKTPGKSVVLDEKLIKKGLQVDVCAKLGDAQVVGQSPARNFVNWEGKGDQYRYVFAYSTRKPVFDQVGDDVNSHPKKEVKRERSASRLDRDTPASSRDSPELPSVLRVSKKRKMKIEVVVDLT